MPREPANGFNQQELRPARARAAQIKQREQLEGAMRAKRDAAQTKMGDGRQ